MSTVLSDTDKKLLQQALLRLTTIEDTCDNESYTAYHRLGRIQALTELVKEGLTLVLGGDK